MRRCKAEYDLDLDSCSVTIRVAFPERKGSERVLPVCLSYRAESRCQGRFMGRYSYLPFKAERSGIPLHSERQGKAMQGKKEWMEWDIHPQPASSSSLYLFTYEHSIHTNNNNFPLITRTSPDTYTTYYSTRLAAFAL